MENAVLSCRGRMTFRGPFISAHGVTCMGCGANSKEKEKKRLKGNGKRCMGCMTVRDLEKMRVVWGRWYPRGCIPADDSRGDDAVRIQ